LASLVLLACCKITGVGVAVMNSGQRRGGIFISYRREETAGQAGRLYDRLSGRFGAGRVFMDVDSIAIGVDFTTAITEAISGCDILLALIGREWLSITDTGGRRRLDDPDDFVRVEIEAALQRDIRVVPVLVEGAVLPHASDMPPSLGPLVRRQAFMISHAGFGAEVSQLIAAVDVVLGAGPGRAAEAGHDSDASGAQTGPLTGTAPASPPVEQEESGEARAHDVQAGLSASDDPTYVDGLSALLAGRFDEAVDHFTALQGRFPRDPKVQERLQKALLRKDSAVWYRQGVAAAERGDWDQAVAAFERVPAAGIADTDAYADTADRLNQARWQQRRHGLIDDVRRLHAAQQWEATIAAGQELTKFDPATPDPDGMITQAQEALAEQALAARYATGLQQFDSQEWPAALDTFTRIEQDRPGYRDTPALLEQLQQRQDVADLERRYAKARAAEDSGDWAGAARTYDKILKVDPAYQDTAARRELCRQQIRNAKLRSKLEQQTAAEAWPEVLATIKELARLGPSSAEQATYTELADRARRELATRPAVSVQRINEPQQLIKTMWQPTAVSWHPDGHHIAVGIWSGGRARVYDISGEQPRKQLAVKIGDWTSGVNDVTFSPDGTRLATSGGEKMVTGGADRTARVWDAATGQQLLEVRHDGPVSSVAFSPDGTRLATADRGATTRVWDAATGRQLLEVRHDGPVSSVAFGPDGTWLASGSDDRTARVWDAATGRQLLKVRHDDGVLSVAFSPDGARLASGSDDRTARVWDAATGRQLLKVRHDGPVSSVSFSPNGTWLATADHGATARAWDAATGQQRLVVLHKEVSSVSFSPDGTRLATAGDFKVRIWPVAGVAT
jgi:WD40 repeat protein/tetratricopeptide (TPR) repeat protein